MAKGKFSEAQRKVCWERSGGYCEVCGCGLRPSGWDLHHRRGRGMGGTKRTMTCADGLVVCGKGNTSGCHRLMDEQRQWAIERGFVVLRSDYREATEVPVLLRGAWTWLLADGTTEQVGIDAPEVPA